MNNDHQNRKHNNRHFSDTYHYVGDSDIPTRIKLVRYRGNNFETKELNNHVPSFKGEMKEGYNHWFRVKGLTDSATITRILKEFGLNSLDARDILTPGHIAKIDDNKRNILIILNSCKYNSKGMIRSDHVCIVAMEKVVLSFYEGEHSIFDTVDRALRLNTMHIREEKSGMLFAFLLNAVIAELMETALKVEKTLEKLEDKLLGNTYSNRSVRNSIQDCRHACLIVRKNVTPLQPEFAKLLKTKEGIIDDSQLIVFNELSDQLEFTSQTIRNSSDILSSLVDVYISNNDLKANAIMQRLTVVATLFIPVTFLVGLWGMNFEFMPELEWKYGYVFAWAAIILTIGISWNYMRRKKWF